MCWCSLSEALNVDGHVAAVGVHATHRHAAASQTLEVEYDDHGIVVVAMESVRARVESGGQLAERLLVSHLMCARS